MTSLSRTTTFALTLCVFGMSLSTLYAQEKAKKPPSFVAQRTEVMKLMSNKMEMIHDMLDGSRYFKPEPFAHAVKELKEKSGSHLTALFPKGSAGGKSHAKTEIWQDWSSFENYANSLRKAAAELEKHSKIAIKDGTIVKVQSVMTRGSYAEVGGKDKDKAIAEMKVMQQSFVAIAKNCKGCHEKFKIPKKKSE